MNKELTEKAIQEYWDQWFVKGLQDFVRVPNLTPMVDSEYLTNGKVEQSIDLVHQYIEKLEIPGLKQTKIQPAGMTPLIVYEVPGEGKSIMLYGHLDKQPYGPGWDADKLPTDPVIIGDYMYGRGCSDDGYAPFIVMLAVKLALL